MLNEQEVIYKISETSGISSDLILLFQYQKSRSDLGMPIFFASKTGFFPAALCSFLRICSLIVQEHDDCGSDYKYIACDTEDIRDVTEKEKSEKCCPKYLDVVVDRDLFGGSIAVGGRDGKLAPCGCGTCKEKHTELVKAHGMIVRDDIRKNRQAGEK